MEMAMIDVDYLKTLFITSKITENGYYQYFIKRNGIYEIDFIDDVIPVEGPKEVPLYNLSYRRPWEILLMKAWFKEKGGVHSAHNAEPFEFLRAFGMPGYRVIQYKRDFEFFRDERVSKEMREDRVSKVSLRRPNISIIAKTKNSSKIRDIGLIPNTLGYRIQHVDTDRRGDHIYKVTSSVPVKWRGSLSVIHEGKIKELYDQVKDKKDGRIKL